MQPEFEDEEAINPFDFWEGANFNLKAKSVAGYRNYDSSGFGKVTALNDDEVLEGVWKKEHSLAELVAPDQFKDYETLKKRLNQVLGVSGTSRPAPQEDSGDEDIESQLRSSRPAFAKEESSYSEHELPTMSSSDDGDTDDAMSYFQSLADW